MTTGFEGFDKFKNNPSWNTVISLPEVEDCIIERKQLPVTADGVSEIIGNLIRSFSPDIIISFGLAYGETAIRVERFALNIKDYKIEDNSGKSPSGDKIKNDGPDAFFVNTNPVKSVDNLIKANIPAYVSNHAGTYVCNTLMYEAMYCIHSLGKEIKFAFIHIPASSEMAVKEKNKIPPSFPQKMIDEAALIILNTLIEK